MNWDPNPNFASDLKRKECDTLSNALSWSIDMKASGELVSLAYVIASLRRLTNNNNNINNNNNK